MPGLLNPNGFNTSPPSLKQGIGDIVRRSRTKRCGRVWRRRSRYQNRTEDKRKLDNNLLSPNNNTIHPRETQLNWTLGWSSTHAHAHTHTLRIACLPLVGLSS